MRLLSLCCKQAPPSPPAERTATCSSGSRTARSAPTSRGRVASRQSLSPLHHGSNFLSRKLSSPTQDFPSPGPTQQEDESIYCLAWAPDSESVAYGSGGRITIKPLTVNTRQVEWVAHEGVVLSLDWCSGNGLLVTGGEDGWYKVRKRERKRLPSPWFEAPLLSVCPGRATRKDSTQFCAKP